MTRRRDHEGLEKYEQIEGLVIWTRRVEQAGSSQSLWSSTGLFELNGKGRLEVENARKYSERITLGKNNDQTGSKSGR